jgi:hypothetical protein
LRHQLAFVGLTPQNACGSFQQHRRAVRWSNRRPRNPDTQRLVRRWSVTRRRSTAAPASRASTTAVAKFLAPDNIAGIVGRTAFKAACGPTGPLASTRTEDRQQRE